MEELSAKEYMQVALANERLASSTLKKAHLWPRKHGSDYNTTLLRAIFKAFAPRLYALCERLRPLDTYQVRVIILEGTRHFDEPVRQHCYYLVEPLAELWNLGVFHWSDCHDMVLGAGESAVAGQKANMGRNRRQRKTKTKARGQHGKPTSASVPIPNEQAYHVAEENSNASIVDDGNAADEDVTKVDDYTAKDDNDDTLVNDEAEDDEIIEGCGIDIFKAVSKRDQRDRWICPVEKPRSSSSRVYDYRSLNDIYNERPEMRLTNIDEETLALAGQAVRQVVFEATHEFLQKCIPENERQNVWNQILDEDSSAGDNSTAALSLSLAANALDFKNGTRSLDDLMKNCISVLKGDFLVTNQNTLRLVFDRGVALCDALNDEKRKGALEQTLNLLSWLMLGLDCKKLQVYRNVNQILEENVNVHFPVDDDMIISRARQTEELRLLESMKRSYDGHKVPFRKNFLESVQRLIGEWE